MTLRQMKKKSKRRICDSRALNLTLRGKISAIHSVQLNSPTNLPLLLLFRMKRLKTKQGSIITVLREPTPLPPKKSITHCTRVAVAKETGVDDGMLTV